MTPITLTCLRCGTAHTLDVGPHYAAWQRREMYAQDAFPHLTADERELLISGTCGSCFNAMFPEDDEEDQ